MRGERKFQRKIEDFTCNHCSFFVKGSGYTNHCPKCLWSRHVDTNPGDRAEGCLGMMEPIGVEKRNSGHIILHRCQKCGKTQRNKLASEDDFDAVVGVSRTLAGGV